MTPPTSNDFFWDVELPKSAKRSMGAPKPKATLVYGEERTRLPVALSLGRALIRDREDSLDPRDAGELLEAVSERESTLAWEWLLKALNRRDLTAREARERLGREGFGARSVDVAVERALENRFIDDRRYADVFASQKAAQGWGRLRIERELERRGVPVSEVEGWSEGRFDREGELERAREALARRSVPERNPYEKFVRFLVARGFDYETAKAAARDRIDADA